MATANKFKDQSTEELRAAHSDLSRGIFRLKNELAVTRKLEKPHRIRMMKKDRARVLTALRERGEKLN